jgi:transposase
MSAATIEDVIDGALASHVAYHQALWDTQSCFILATSERDTTALPALEVLKGYNGPSRPERGFRFRKDPRFLASSLSRKKPERIMAFLMVMTVCLLVSAALEYRVRQALRSQHKTFPAQKGRPLQHPTARGVFHFFVGLQVLLGVGEHPVVVNLNDQHQLLLKLLGAAYERLYA